MREAGNLLRTTVLALTAVVVLFSATAVGIAQPLDVIYDDGELTVVRMDRPDGIPYESAAPGVKGAAPPKLTLYTTFSSYAPPTNPDCKFPYWAWLYSDEVVLYAALHTDKATKININLKITGPTKHSKTVQSPVPLQPDGWYGLGYSVPKAVGLKVGQYQAFCEIAPIHKGQKVQGQCLFNVINR